MALKQGGSLFSPPQGLQPNEEVLWVQESEARERGKCGVVVMVLVGSLFLASGLYYNILPVLGIGVLIILGGIFVGYQSKPQGGVRYYLTNFRFVKSNHGRIVTELPRRMFRGKSFHQFLSVFRAPLQRGPVEMFAVQVLNPDTGNIAMNLGLLPGEIVKRLESINEEVYCQYCGRKNDPNANDCSNYGAKLENEHVPRKQ